MIRHLRLPMIFLLSLASATTLATELGARVELKNDRSAAVLVQVPDTALTAESTFEVLDSAGRRVSLLYPTEIFADQMWSQALDPTEFTAVQVGMTVRPVELSASEYRSLRAEGRARGLELAAQRRATRSETVKTRLAELRRKRSELLRNRLSLERKMAAAEVDLIDAEERMDLTELDQEDTIDRHLEDLLELVDEREELQSLRAALVEKDPFPRDDFARLTNQIDRVSDKIDSTRDRIGSSRKKQRTAAERYVSRRSDWRKLVAARNALLLKLDTIDAQILELTEAL